MKGSIALLLLASVTLAGCLKASQARLGLPDFLDQQAPQARSDQQDRPAPPAHRVRRV